MVSDLHLAYFDRGPRPSHLLKTEINHVHQPNAPQTDNWCAISMYEVRWTFVSPNTRPNYEFGNQHNRESDDSASTKVLGVSM